MGKHSFGGCGSGEDDAGSPTAFPKMTAAKKEKETMTMWVQYNPASASAAADVDLWDREHLAHVLGVSACQK